VDTNQHTSSNLLFAQVGGFTNDDSCLNKTLIFGITRPKSIAKIKNTVAYANKNKILITVAGKQYSMGGQSFNYHGIIVEMQNLNCM
jgi:FAD/FMN-containing dehydrogenase